MAEIPNDRLSGQPAAPTSDRQSELIEAIRRTRARVSGNLNRLEGDLRAVLDGDGRVARTAASGPRTALDTVLAYTSLARRVYLSTTRLSGLLPRGTRGAVVSAVASGIAITVLARRRHWPLKTRPNSE